MCREADVAAPTTLYRNYPNPFNFRIIIQYQIDRPGRVSLKIYDVSGSLVRILEERYRTTGRYEVSWNGRNDRGELSASGVYFYRMSTNSFIATRKLRVRVSPARALVELPIIVDYQNCPRHAAAFPSVRMPL